MEKRVRTVVITGASSGVGRAIALAFAEQGDRIVLASRNINELEDVALACNDLGGSARCVEADVSVSADMINLAATADEFGAGIDIWINNAGVLAIGEFATTPMEISTEVVKINLLGYMNGVHAVLPYFKERGRGIVINNISIGGFLPVPFGAGYSASKFGLRGFSAALKGELSQFPNIHICDVFPAFLDTPGIQHAANYTGRQIKPAPPVYDPNRVAMALVKIANHPKSTTMVGSMSILLRCSYALFPRITRGITGTVIKTYLKNAKSIEFTSGNIFNPAKYGNAVHGGWGLPGKPKAHRKFIAGGLLALAVIGVLLLGKR